MPDPRTTAKIDPEHLITRLGEDIPTCQDDRLCHLHWAFQVPQYINPSRKTIQKRYVYQPYSFYTPLRRPIGVNIETKRTGEDLRDAQYKLQTLV